MNRFYYGMMLFCILLSCTYFASESLGQGKLNSNNSDLTKKEAEHIWELAIKAKGGRAKLYAVRNMAVSSSGRFYMGFKKINIRDESLYIFPNKEWLWNDQRPSVFGLDMTMHNWDTKEMYHVVYKGEPFNGLSLMESVEKVTNGAGLIHYFLETKWNKPVPEKVTKGKVGSRKVNVIQTSFIENRADFMFDTESYLLLRVAYYTNQRLSNSIRFSDYVDVNGIKMPTKGVLESSDGEMEYRVAIQLNVEYDESIFSRPPSFEFGPEAWKIKR